MGPRSSSGTVADPYRDAPVRELGPDFDPLDVNYHWTTLNWMIEDMLKTGRLVLHRGEYSPKDEEARIILEKWRNDSSARIP